MARVVSINISGGKGERKAPVGSAVLKPGHGLEGDGHAGEGDRQVSLLALESIEKMRARGLEVNPGDFAENITTSGVDLLTLPVGVRLRLGEEAVVEVTRHGKQCHAPCDIYRQAGECVMPTEGVFAVVVTGGGVRDGDELAVLGGNAPSAGEGGA